MPEDTKSPPPPPTGEPKAPAGEPVPASVQSSPDKPAPPKTAEPTVPAKPSGPTPLPWDSPMISRLRGQHGSGIGEANTYLGQKYIVADSSLVPEVLRVLRDQEAFDYCVDITAIHYPGRDKQI